MIYKKLTSVILAAFLALGATACSSGSSSSASTSASADASSNGDVKKVLIGIRQDLYPTSYVNEQGEPSGYDIDVIKKIDELLPEYEFEYEAVSQIGRAHV